MMKKIKQFIFSPKATLTAFGTAVALLLFSSIGGARAALTYYSENHMTEIKTQTIGVALVEGDVQNPGTLLGTLLNEGEKLKLGMDYEENLSVRNTGEIDQYVRVTIYKSWVNGSGTKRDVDPAYIKLNLMFSNGWVEDPSASTMERTVIYYTKPLSPGESVQFADTLSIDPAIASIVTAGDGGASYDYQGLEVCLEVDVDAVQTHHAKDAILSAWGCKVTGSHSGGDENGALGNLSFNW